MSRFINVFEIWGSGIVFIFEVFEKYIFNYNFVVNVVVNILNKFNDYFKCFLYILFILVNEFY